MDTWILIQCALRLQPRGTQHTQTPLHVYPDLTFNKYLNLPHFQIPSLRPQSHIWVLFIQPTLPFFSSSSLHLLPFCHLPPLCHHSSISPSPFPFLFSFVLLFRAHLFMRHMTCKPKSWPWQRTNTNTRTQTHKCVNAIVTLSLKGSEIYMNFMQSVKVKQKLCLK